MNSKKIQIHIHSLMNNIKGKRNPIIKVKLFIVPIATNKAFIRHLFKKKIK